MPRLTFDATKAKLTPENSERIWSLGPGFPPTKMSVLLDNTRIELRDGHDLFLGDVALIGEPASPLTDWPTHPYDLKRFDYRWIPDLHKIFQTLKIKQPECLKENDELPERPTARMQLMGGRLGSKNILWRNTKPRRFKFERNGAEHIQPFANAVRFHADVDKYLAIELLDPITGSRELRIEFDAGSNPDITISNDPLEFMEGPNSPIDFELVYRLLEVEAKPLPDEIQLMQTTSRPCSCTSC